MMKFVKRAFILCVVAIGAGYAWLLATTVAANELPQLESGDLVFQTSGSGQSLAILAASRSPYTHVGMIEKAPDGGVQVVEAIGPVTSTPLDEWIDRGNGKRVTIKRFKSINGEQKAKLLAAAHALDGLPYDIFFLNGEDAIYCSELVYLAFKQGLGLSVGKVEKVRDLSINNFASRGLIEKRWRKHPLCAKGGADTFESCFAKILEQELVTPASIAADPRFELVFSNYGVLAN
jgi:hypothetical protein